MSWYVLSRVCTGLSVGDVNVGCLISKLLDGLQSDRVQLLERTAKELIPQYFSSIEK
jgi:hypothetical protein